MAEAPHHGVMGRKAPHCRTVPDGTVSVSPSASRAMAGFWVVAGLAGALGCGLESQGSDRTDAVDASQPPDPTSDRYSPDIPNIYDGDMEEPGLEVIAHTILELRYWSYMGRTSTWWPSGTPQPIPFACWS
jgi:hypothetical protein